MKFQNILCVLKKSSLVQCSSKEIKHLPTYRKSFLQKAIDAQKKAEKQLRTILKNLNVTYINDSQVTKKMCKDADLIITLGGDGTFLATAQHCDKTPILGVNSNPCKDPKIGSIGALTSITIDQVKTKLPLLFQEKFTLIKRSRLQLSLNGKLQSPLATNEIFFGPKDADKTCDFQLTYNKHKEVFNSSGLIIATPTGSTGWFKNAGGKKFTSGFGFIVREANRDRKPAFCKGNLSLSQSLIFETGANDVFLSFDSLRENRIKLDCKNAKIKIGIAKGKDLNVIKL